MEGCTDRRDGYETLELGVPGGRLFDTVTAVADGALRGELEARHFTPSSCHVFARCTADQHAGRNLCTLPPRRSHRG
ncbi:MAG: hypothetical protein WBP81_25505 [Solirubrobacteraceae bacterium]